VKAWYTMCAIEMRRVVPTVPFPWQAGGRLQTQGSFSKLVLLPGSEWVALVPTPCTGCHTWSLQFLVRTGWLESWVWRGCSDCGWIDHSMWAALTIPHEWWGWGERSQSPAELCRDDL